MRVVKRFLGVLRARWTTTTGISAITALAVFASALVYAAQPQAEIEPRVTDGAAWLRSTGVGLVSLLDGAGGDVIATFDVASPNDEIDVFPSGSDAVILNRTTSTISRLSAATWERSRPLSLDFEVDDVLAGSSISWLVRPGFASTIDLTSFELRDSVPVGGNYASGHVSEEGVLFLSAASPDQPPTRIELVEGEPVVLELDGLDGPVSFSSLNDGTVGVDLDDGQVWLEGQGVVCPDLRLSSDQVVAASGYDRSIVVTDDGVVLFWDPSTTGCPAGADVIDIGPGRYGEPAVADGWAAIPDLESGELWIVSSEGSPISVSPEVRVAGSGLEVEAENNTIWFNQPESNIAGVVRRDGSNTISEKYIEGSDAGIVTPPLEEEQEEDPALEVAGSQQLQTTTTEEVNEQDETPATGEQELTTTTTSGGPDPTEPPGENGTDESTTTSEGVTETTEGPAPPTSSPLTPPSTDDPFDPTTTTTSTTAAPSPGPVVQIAREAIEPTAGEQTLFSAQTVSGAPVSYSWSVLPDNGVRQADGSDLHYTFDSPGPHTVQVEACDSENRCGTAAVSVDVVSEETVIPVSASFTGKRTAEVGEVVTFQSTSQGDPDSHSWTFEGGAPSSATGASASASWSQPGDYRVTLRATRGDTSDLHTEQITIVQPAPPPSIGLACSPSTLSVGSSTNCSLEGSSSDFTNISLTSSPSGPSISQNGPGEFLVTSSSTGTFTMTLNARNASDGDARSASDTVVFEAEPVVEPPQISISGPATAVTGEAIRLTGTAASGTVTSWSWDTSGGSPASSNQQAISVSWPSAGSYAVELEVTGPGGTRSTTHTVTVSQAPEPIEVQIVPGSATTTEGQPVTLRAEVVSGAVTSWAWDTDGGSPATGNTSGITLSWASAGTYDVTVTGSGPQGSDTDTITVVVEPDQVVHTAVVTLNSPEDTTFTLVVETDACSTIVWSIPAISVGPYSDSTCTTTHRISPRTSVVLTPNTTYSISAAFSFEDGQVLNRTYTVTTTNGPDPVPPQATTSISVSGAQVTVTMTSVPCTLITNAWFSSTDGGTLGIEDHKGFFPDESGCKETRQYSFTMQPNQGHGPGPYRPYRIKVTYTDPATNGSTTTVDNI